MKVKNVPLYIDLAFCIIVLPMMIMIFPIERWFHNFQWYVISVGIWLYALYFLNRHITVPWIFKNKQYALGATLIIITSFGMTYAISRITLYEPKPSIYDYGFKRILPDIQPYQQAVWSLFMIVEAFSFAVGLLIQTGVQRERRREVESQKNKAELNLYKAQIKPHFMFNTLNSLYGLFLTKSDLALVSLERFISMMRYVYVTSALDKVTLAEEADYIRQYVELQSLRLNSMTEVHLDIDIENNSLTVPPMLLITFTENCFKHGISPIEKSHIYLSLREKGKRIEFITKNRIFPVKRTGEHIGIENCRKRLEFLYPQRHELCISNDGLYFQVRLLIDLTA